MKGEMGDEARVLAIDSWILVIFEMKNELNELTRVEHFFVVLSRTSVKEFVEGTPHRTGIRIRVEFLLNGGGAGV